MTISILYIPYEQLVTTHNQNVAYENVKVNALIPGLPKILQSCASPGFYRSASTDTEINDALQAMFVQATAVARLTQ